jgi:hypothetical protein
MRSSVLATARRRGPHVTATQFHIVIDDTNTGIINSNRILRFGLNPEPIDVRVAEASRCNAETDTGYMTRKVNMGFTRIKVVMKAILEAPFMQNIAMQIRCRLIRVLLVLAMVVVVVLYRMTPTTTLVLSTYKTYSSTLDKNI